MFLPDIEDAVAIGAECDGARMFEGAVVEAHSQQAEVIDDRGREGDEKH